MVCHIERFVRLSITMRASVYINKNYEVITNRTANETQYSNKQCFAFKLYTFQALTEKGKQSRRNSSISSMRKFQHEFSVRLHATHIILLK